MLIYSMVLVEIESQRGPVYRKAPCFGGVVRRETIAKMAAAIRAVNFGTRQDNPEIRGKPDQFTRNRGAESREIIRHDFGIR